MRWRARDRHHRADADGPSGGRSALRGTADRSLRRRRQHRVATPLARVGAALVVIGQQCREGGAEESLISSAPTVPLRTSRSERVNPEMSAKARVPRSCM